MRIIELFGGIGACTKALKRLGVELEVVDYVEIDKYAVASYNAINGTNFEPQDITKWKKDLRDIDLISHGSPCQDFSIAGKQAGGDEGSGTRSSLMYETVRIVEKIKPKYVIWENVKNVISKKHKHNFDRYIERLKEIGYNSYYEVLNAKDYGIPQNRERVFTISIRKDIDNKTFEFPQKQELKLRLKDMLEDEVDEKYYLTMKQQERLQTTTYQSGKYENRVRELDGICNTLAARDYKEPKCMQVGNLEGGRWDKINESCKRVYSEQGVSPTIHTCQGGNTEPKIMIKNATKKGYLEANAGDSVNLAYANSESKRARVGKQVAHTLQCTNKMGVVENIGKETNELRIRKLTPLETWRLMGFEDEDFQKAKKVNSNTQLYKQAGNSIVVNVLEKIFKNLLGDGE